MVKQRWIRVINNSLILLAISASLSCSWLFDAFTVAERPVYLSVKDLLDDKTYIGQRVYVYGTIVEDTLRVNSASGKIAFELAYFENTEPENVESAINNPHPLRVNVIMDDIPLPPMVTESLITVVGTLHEDSVFYADRLMIHDESLHVKQSFDLFGSITTATASPVAR